MNSYSSTHILKHAIGNNAFSFHERKKLGSSCELTIPSLKEISSISEIELGTDIVFEEVDHKGQLHSCTGLKHIYSLKHSHTQARIHIMDNHNHALYFWDLHNHSDTQALTHIIHIDQHSDLNQAPAPLDTDNIREYTNKVCNIGNFIPPYLEAYPETNFARIKSEAEMLEFTNTQTLKHSFTILDIDLDFRAPEMSIQAYDTTIAKVTELMTQADLITIASSPFFIDQKKALAVLQDLFYTE